MPKSIDHDGLAYTRSNKAEQIHGNVCAVKADRGEGNGVETQTLKKRWEDKRGR